MTLLRHFDEQFAGVEGEVGALAAFHVFGGGLRKRCDEDRKRDGRVAVDVGGLRAACEFAVG